jgi:hypothetical protein
MIHLARFLILFLVSVVLNAQEEKTTNEVKITHIDHNEGQMLIGLYDSEDNDGELDTFLKVTTEDTRSSNDAPAKLGSC